MFTSDSPILSLSSGLETPCNTLLGWPCAVKDSIDRALGLGQGRAIVLRTPHDLHEIAKLTIAVAEAKVSALSPDLIRQLCQRVNRALFQPMWWGRAFLP
jgi:hypothetical protein